MVSNRIKNISNKNVLTKSFVYNFQLLRALVPFPVGIPSEVAILNHIKNKILR